MLTPSCGPTNLLTDCQGGPDVELARNRQQIANVEAKLQTANCKPQTVNRKP